MLGKDGGKHNHGDVAQHIENKNRRKQTLGMRKHGKNKLVGPVL